MESIIQNLSQLAAIKLTVVIGIIGLGIVTLEQIKTQYLHRDDHVLSWQIAQWMNPNIGGTLFRGVLNLILDYKQFQWLFKVRLLLLFVLLVLPVHTTAFSVIVMLIFVSLLLPVIRNPYGNDGAYQMYMIIFGTLSLSLFVAIDGLMGLILMANIALQLLLSYAVSGIAKLKSATWLDGSAIIGITGTRIYGNPYLFGLFRTYKGMALLVCLSVIILEVGFVIAFLFANTQVFLLFMGLGVLFHLGTAIFMGLNNFFFAFVATYPCVWYLYTLL